MIISLSTEVADQAYDGCNAYTQVAKDIRIVCGKGTPFAAH